MKFKITMLLFIAVALVGGQAFAGSLTPPGAPAPTMKTLDQVEPRIPITQAMIDALPAGEALVLDVPGQSYYFTEEIVTDGNPNSSDPNKAGAGIMIAADYITLDMMGYRLRPAQSAIDGAGDVNEIGIWIGNETLATHMFGVTVKNGTVYGYEGDGIHDQASGTHLRDITVSSVGGEGFWVGDTARYYNCEAMATCKNGFKIGSSSSRFINCRSVAAGKNGLADDEYPGFVNDTTADGFHNNANSSIFVDCSAWTPANDGFECKSRGARLTRCMVDSAGGAGICLRSNGSTADDCTVVLSNIGIQVVGNGNVVSNCLVEWTGNMAIYLEPSAGNVVRGNTIFQANYGINCDASRTKIVDNSIDLGGGQPGIKSSGTNNVVTGNKVSNCPGTGIQVSGVNSLTTCNTVTAVATTPYNVTGGSWGPIVDLRGGAPSFGVGDISISALAGENHPQANYIH